MFCFKAGIFLEELQKYSPEIYQTCEQALGGKVSTLQKVPQQVTVSDSHPGGNASALQNIIRIKQEAMQQIPADSIDYAVIEKSNRVKVVPSNIDWSDLGSFDALYEELPKDENGNTQNGNHISIDSQNNLVFSHDKQIATIDIEDLIIVVKPGKRLSLQKHFHRNEHWIVVSGTATVTVGDEVKLIRPNESTYIKMGEIHRLENEGKIPVVLIEAQVGEYTGEDDIVRIEDDFKRA